MLKLSTMSNYPGETFLRNACETASERQEKAAFLPAPLARSPLRLSEPEKNGGSSSLTVGATLTPGGGPTLVPLAPVSTPA